MVYLFNGFADRPARPVPPQRRRTIIIGAGPTGISAALHLGEHCLLLDRRTELKETHDHSLDFPLGSTHGGTVGAEDPHTDGQRPALFISCGSASEASPDARNLIHVTRWEPPSYAPVAQSRDAFAGSESRESIVVRALLPLIRGELGLGAYVVRVSPSLHLLELYDGRRFVYDKLLSTIPLPALTNMVMHEMTSRISNDDSLRYWLGEQDIELADQATQFCQGDVDEIAAGKRVAGNISRALAGRFQANRHSPRGAGLFRPHLVEAAATSTP